MRPADFLFSFLFVISVITDCIGVRSMTNDDFLYSFSFVIMAHFLVGSFYGLPITFKIKPLYKTSRPSCVPEVKSA